MAKTMSMCVLALLSLPATAGSGAGEGRVLFQDDFKEKLAVGWSWLRENREAWRIREKALEIRVEPGVAPTVKNALVRDVPPGVTALAAEVTITNEPAHQYEQAGIVWYRDGEPVVKLVKELIDGKVYVVLSGEGFFQRVVYEEKAVQLRFEVEEGRFAGLFRAGDKAEWRRVGTKELRPGKKHQISIQCYNGPPAAERWIRFERFRLLDLSRT